MQNSKKHKKLKRYLFMGFVVALLATVTYIGYVYCETAIYYRTHFFPNTFINNINCSGLDTYVVSQLLDEQAQQYTIQIVGRDEEGKSSELGIIHGRDIELALTDSLAGAEEILAQQDETRWYEIYQNKQYNYSVVQGVTFNEELLESRLEDMDAFQRKKMKQPSNAYIGKYIKEKGKYELVSETQGTKVNMKKVQSCVAAAIVANATTVDLQEQGCYVLPRITTEDENLQKNLETANTWLKARITYDWNGSQEKVDKDIIKNWITIKDNRPILEEKKILDFVKEKAEQYDTYGKSRNFTTTLGVELVLPSGAFGWKTDCEAEAKELVALIKEGSTVKKEPVYSNKAPHKGTNDIGSSYVEADLTNQHLYLYYKGNLVLETDFVSGDMSKSDCITPQGVFGITYKTTNAVLRGADYEIPVTFWMPFHGNFGMHDATWRTEFGGVHYMSGNGSHGCLNLPLDKAGEIYNYMYTGYPVICYYY